MGGIWPTPARRNGCASCCSTSGGSRAKLAATTVHALLQDFELAGSGGAFNAIAGALRLSAYHLGRDPDQLGAQLAGRLDPTHSPGVDRLLRSISETSGRRAFGCVTRR